MSGGGIGIDYSVFREQGALLKRTGGTASGPLPLAKSINEHGRNVKQGGSRRSAIYGSLNWQHGDATEWLYAKDWANIKVPGTDVSYAEAKKNNFDAPAPLDFTNVSLNYDNAWLSQIAGEEDRKSVV
jgi:ribonucleoside-diphosphate reductase alpha chain